MAKQVGPVKLIGTIGDITFLKTQDGYLAKMRSSIASSRVKSGKAFQRTREVNAEFSQAARAGKLVRSSVKEMLQNAKDGKVVSRLQSKTFEVIHSDITS